MNDPQFQYFQGQMRETFPPLLAAYEAESQAALTSEACVLDVRYGPLERQTFDFFAARGRPRATLLYFHAGYWQSRDKSTFRFVAPPYTVAGLNVALVNYPLCPTVSLAQLVEAARASVPAIQAHAAAGGASPALVVSGHSAGGHLAIEMGLTRWPSSSSTSAPEIAGIVAMSGIFDLAPLVATSLNDKLRLDESAAAACSPLHRVHSGAPPALMVVGGAETPAFVDQSRRMHAAWIESGNRSGLQIEADADHFSLLRSFSSPGSALFSKVLGLLG